MAQIELKMRDAIEFVDIPQLKKLIAGGGVSPHDQIRHPDLTGNAWRPLGETSLVVFFPNVAATGAKTQKPGTPADIDSAVQQLDRDLRLYSLIRQRPLLTYALVALNLAIWFVIYILSHETAPDTVLLIAFGAKHKPFIDNGEWWRVISAMFLHASILHLALNAVAIWVLGRFLEGVLGRNLLLAIYGASGIAGGIASHLFSSGPSVGASGAVFGLLGAALVFVIKHKKHLPIASRRFVIVMLALFVVANLIFGFFQQAVDSYAHIGGLIIGVVLTLVLPGRLAPPRAQRRARWLLAILNIALIVVVVFAAAMTRQSVLDSGLVSPIRGKLVEHPRLQMTVPASWQVIANRKRTVSVGDRLAIRVTAQEIAKSFGGLDAAMRVYSRLLRRKLGGRWSRLSRGRIKVGKRSMLWSSFTVSSGGKRTLFDIYLVKIGRIYYGLRFESAEAFIKHYNRHIRFVLEHFKEH